MKRAAEHQLTKDSSEDDSDESGEGTFQRASESELAGRKIRSLPKRNGAVLPEPASKPPSLGTFSGFGGSSTIAASASNTAKTFASFLDTTASSNGTEPDAVKYYSSLRGLNVSFGAAVAKALGSDPFTDISSLLETYREHRQNIQKEYDQKAPAKSATPQETVKESAPDSSAPKMPAPPSSFKGFGAATSSSTSSSSSGPGFTPTATASSSSSPFSFPPASNSPSKPSPFSFKPSTEPAPLSTSIFGSPATPSLFGDASSASAPKNPFGTTSPFGSSNPFGAPISTSPSKLEASAFSFSSTKPESNPFGGSTLSAPQTDSTPAAPTPTSSASTTSVFGKPSSAFGGFSGFGKASNTLGGSVGWGFGSGSGSSTSAAKSDENNNTESQDSRASSVATGESQEGQDSAEPKADAAMMFATPSVHDEEGVGEEDEETTHSIKLKVYKFKKDPPEGTSPWADLGAGVLRLKRHKTDDTRRMLLRNSSTGKININFNIYGGENPKLTKNAIMFTGHDEGKPQAYTVRTKTEQQAQELKAAMDREIAFVKAKQAD